MRRVALAVLLLAADLAVALPLPAQSLPKGVEQAVFAGEKFAGPIIVPLPALETREHLSAFRRAVAHGGGMLSPVAPTDYVQRSDDWVRFGCFVHAIALESVTTREGIRLDYAVAAPELEKLIPRSATGLWANAIPAAKRKLKTIDYHNRYKANPLGMGEREMFAITFSYTLESIVQGLPSPPTIFKGKATAQLDPEDGEWKLEKLTLSDEGER